MRAGLEAEGTVRMATAFLLVRVKGATVAWTVRLRSDILPQALEQPH